MTFKSLMNLGSLGNLGKASYPGIDRYHSGSGGYHHGGYHHGSHGHYKSKGGGSGAALSALTLLAFLFLINVMQQSLQENNSTAVPPTTTVLLREDEVPVVLDTRENTEPKKRDGPAREPSYGASKPSKSYVRLNN